MTSIPDRRVCRAETSLRPHHIRLGWHAAHHTPARPQLRTGGAPARSWAALTGTKVATLDAPILPWKQGPHARRLYESRLESVGLRRRWNASKGLGPRIDGGRGAPAQRRRRSPPAESARERAGDRNYLSAAEPSQSGPHTSAGMGRPAEGAHRRPHCRDTCPREGGRLPRSRTSRIAGTWREVACGASPATAST
jgi:hypothetical protein